MTKITAQTIWLVEPRDNATNERIASFLRESQANEDAAIIRDIRGIEHNLWTMPSYEKLQMLICSANNLGLKFKVWERHTPNGIIYEAPSWAQIPKKKRTRRKIVLQAASRL